jgi:GMP reductase
MQQAYLSYQDVFLKPRFSPFPSRSGIDASVQFGPQRFNMPIVPANMACVISAEISKWMSERGFFYIMHRFNADHSFAANQDNMAFVQLANEENWKTISISIGVQDSDKKFLNWIIQNKYRVDYITIDIAHAHSLRMREMLEFIRKLNFSWISHTAKTPDEKLAAWVAGSTQYRPFIIAGNVATPEAVVDLENWGADSVKVGIAQGDACTTYGQTGFGMPMFTCMLECAAVAKKPLIADGGVRMNGDFAKAVRAGGSMVMAGSVFAACSDSPSKTVIKLFKTGEVSADTEIYNNMVQSQYKERVVTKVFKQYYGSASEYNKGTKHHVEGRLVELPCNGMLYEEKLTEMLESFQSSISYAGGDLSTVEWGIINK